MARRHDLLAPEMASCGWRHIADNIYSLYVINVWYIVEGVSMPRYRRSLIMENRHRVCFGNRNSRGIMSSITCERKYLAV